MPDASWRRIGGDDDGDRDYGGDKTFTKIMAVGGERERIGAKCGKHMLWHSEC